MILDDIVANKIIQVEEEKTKVPIEFYRNKALNMPDTMNFRKKLGDKKIGIIAEIKKASPSKGIIKENFNVKSIADVYKKIDIDAVSVLTERKFFLGKDEYIAEVKDITKKPILRKDFIVDEYQIFQARCIGADAVLLIVAVLKDKLRCFYEISKSIGLSSIVEVHDESELEIALKAGVDIIGINNRNLKDFSVNLKNTEKLIKYIPSGILIVSESGIKTPEDVNYLGSIGVNAVLIGETFMKNIENIHSINNFIKSSGKF
ncbi:MAG: indole-3-glycerol phosphate synthase TrpC [Clostridium sp.]|nr:indole-3-glycerol phosphate synthase TrpC [Clostridium sp.]